MTIGLLLTLFTGAVYAAGTQTYDPVAAKAARDKYMVPERKFCGTFAPVAVQRALDSLSAIDSQIEAVPPDEATYLDKEYQDAGSSGNAARLAMVYQRPYFYAWRVHHSVDMIRGNLTKIGQFTIDTPPVDTIKHAALAISDVPLAVDAFGDYERFDRARTPRVLTDAQVTNLQGRLLGLSGSLSQLIICTADTFE
ncbi:hypothetical protein [Burkholderia ubonensis]|uniref:hypothetical protein n=1 Tax=Burkholderia ubonensis TaxID=101571 RepID=UPI0012F97F48|nr:hypothetical protein [Burkholderia ubonensis]